MKPLVLALAGLLCTPLIAQSPFEVKPRLIHKFESGAGEFQLGLLSPSEGASDQGETRFPMALAVDSGRFLVLDNVNKRVVSFSRDFSRSQVLTAVDQGIIRIWLIPDGLILGHNISGSNQNRAVLLVSNLRKPTTASLENLLAGSSRYGFRYVTKVRNSFVFQNIRNEYIAIEPKSSGEANNLVRLSEQEMLQRLEKSGGKFWFTGRSLLADVDGITQVLSRAPVNLKSFFHTLQNFANTFALETLSRAGRTNPQSVLEGMLDSWEFYPLPNGNYLFTSGRQLIVVASDGSLLKYGVIADDPGVRVDSTPSPSPDGTIYYLHAEPDDNSVSLFGIGPLPEISLEFGSIGAITTDDRINLRDSPSTKGAVLLQVEKAVPVRILEKTEKQETIEGLSAPWYKVRLWDRTEGWVFGAFLDVPKP